MHIVADRFDVTLFQALAPRFPKMELLRHDPIVDGGEVHLLLKAGPVHQRWVSVISNVEHTETYFQFVDEGRELPFPFRRWKHTHRVESIDAESCCIIDDITCSTGLRLLDFFAYPVVKKMFSARAPLYVAFFEQ